MVIPHQQLQPQTLDALIEEFVTRDGAVHGHHDTPLPALIQAVRRQLDCGKAVVVFDPEAETCSIVLQSDLDVGDAGPGSIDPDEDSQIRGDE